MGNSLKKRILTFEKELLLKNQAIESSINAIALADIEGNIVYINTSFIKMFGFDNKNIFLRRNADCFWDKQVEATELIENIHEKGSWSGELTARKKDGSHLITLASANIIRDDLDEGIAIMISFIDVSKEKELETEFETIFNSVNDGILIWDSNCKLLEINQIACDGLGYSRAELLQMTVMDITPPELVEPIGEQIIAKMHLGGGIVETLTRCKDGLLLPIELNIRPIKYKGIDAILAVARDTSERKKAERKIKESEAKYRALFHYNSAVMLIIDPDTGNIIDANPAACSYYGYDIKELKHMKISDINIFSKDRVLEEMENARSEKRKQFTFTHRLSSGEMRNVDVYSCPIVINDKKVLCSIIHDITDCKKAEADLMTGTENYISLVENGNDGIIVIQDDLLKFANQKFMDICGFSKDEIIGNSFFDLVSTEYKEIAQERYNKRFSSENVPNNYEIEIVSKDGNFIPVEIIGSIIVYEGKPGDMIIIRDITERKHMMEALQKSEQKFRYIFNNSNDSIIIYDLDGSIIEVNEVACQFTGYSRDEMLSMSVMDLDSPEQAAKMSDNIKRLQKGKRDILESVTICKDGTPVPIELSNRLIEYEGKTAVLCIARDITERKKQNIK
ncbi:MAG: PAS domain S-box protein [Methanococcoides sp.]|nr:PAS domain S-box protein [Methanococcoides sp.]